MIRSGVGDTSRRCETGEDTILIDDGESGCAGRGLENDGDGMVLGLGLEKTSMTGDREGWRRESGTGGTSGGANAVEREG